MSTDRSPSRAPVATPDAPLPSSHRVRVKEVWFSRPLPKLAQGAAYIGDGPAWPSWSVLADTTERVIIVTTPQKLTLRVPFENVTCFIH